MAEQLNARRVRVALDRMEYEAIGEGDLVLFLAPLHQAHISVTIDFTRLDSDVVAGQLAGSGVDMKRFWAEYERD